MKAHCQLGYTGMNGFHLGVTQRRLPPMSNRFWLVLQICSATFSPRLQVVHNFQSQVGNRNWAVFTVVVSMTVGLNGFLDKFHNWSHPLTNSTKDHTIKCSSMVNKFLNTYCSVTMSLIFPGWSVCSRKGCLQSCCYHWTISFTYRMFSHCSRDHHCNLELAEADCSSCAGHKCFMFFMHQWLIVLGTALLPRQGLGALHISCAFSRLTRL